MKIFQNLKLIISFSLILSSIPGCINFRISSPLPKDTVAEINGFSYTSTDQIVIKVVFTQAVNSATVMVGKTLILKFAKNINAAASLQWTDSKTLLITTTATRNDLMTLTPDGGFFLTLVGTDNGNGAVKSQNSTNLDGDYDGKSGGDYVKVFRVIG